MKKHLILLSLFLIFVSCERGWIRNLISSEDEIADTIGPTVVISSHTSGQTVSEIIMIVADTEDDGGISKVEFFIDDSLVLTDTETPYQYDWNTTQYEDNSEHIVKVISYDNSDNSTESQPILLRVDNTLSIPTPSELYPITYNDGFQISWSQNNDDDFLSYKLFESLSEDMSNDTLIYETDDRIDTTFVKTIQNVRYYQIVVEDFWGFHSTSNIEVGDYFVELWGQSYSIENTTELGLSGLTGEIPPEIGDLINLETLLLSGNQLTGSIPPEIGNLTNLTYLGLSHSQLTGEIPIQIGSLTNLQHLNLEQNQLTGSIPPEIGNLTNLTFLHLAHNSLTGPIPEEIWNLSNLEAFELQNNQLTGEIPESICYIVMDFDLSFGITNNQLCPPYPSCIEDYVGEQDTSDCP